MKIIEKTMITVGLICGATLSGFMVLMGGYTLTAVVSLAIALILPFMAACEDGLMVVVGLIPGWLVPLGLAYFLKFEGLLEIFFST